MASNDKNASLAVIDYEALANKDGGEIQKLVQACESVGMFHLSLGNSRMKAIYEDIPNLLEAGSAFFSLPSDSEEKRQSLREGMERGYHAAKTFEYYEARCTRLVICPLPVLTVLSRQIARDEYLQGKWALPASLSPYEERITRILQGLNRVIHTVLAELCDSVQVDLAELSDDPMVPSDTALKLVYKPPVQEPGAVVQPWHTDFGLMTTMWYEEVSAQIPVYDAEGKRTEDWQAVPVVDGALLVNIADQLEAKCHGRLRSTVHRAVTPPGPKKERRGLVYLLRPYKG
ncbi:oxidoreductase, 2OG-Fe(II) oxygenase family [Cordyceps fumosorosea ARSEF 2679]|uniref:Oxidoreductase, 2OG-Fe(II) oxygenase family n=1 Tax=Cordyceps fumosorosea (strain ARSEF 2679) TaxID=1081104 RepID=A0A162J3T2_CORFA|nr:oxidoreductase, 2OG-Fe(II) oxygenase family [Cordyceps fumosorosea ARSEF 2679]OAA39048.1 oxidoreductase, 2OG-Fe(II) oxygenase family [Cordyceps fumosorosea ARSEF 2679]